nr:transposase, MuDR, MULE transposase domain protein [Tanacetum cinerariifolium]
MACSLSHTDPEDETLVQKLIDEDKGRQNTILDLALQFENSSTAKDNLREMALMSTEEYMQKVVEDVGEDDDFKSGALVSATNYVTATGGTVTGC